jgi:hypothetical protein
MSLFLFRQVCIFNRLSHDRAHFLDRNCLAAEAALILRPILPVLVEIEVHCSLKEFGRCQISTAFLNEDCPSVSSLSEADKAALIAFGGRPATRP